MTGVIDHTVINLTIFALVIGLLVAIRLKARRGP